MSREVFLDSSIVISRQKGARFRGAIDAHLGEFPFVGTSSYAKTEYGNVVLSNASLCLRKIAQYGSLAKAQEWFANCVPYQRGGWKTWGFNLLTKHFGRNEAEMTERARLMLQTMLRLGTKFVDQTVDCVVDGTGCAYARQRATKSKKGPRWPIPKCKQKQPLCSIVQFFVQNRALFERIRDRVGNVTAEDMTDQLKNFRTTIGKACANPCILQDYKNCKRLADAIIAVDSKGWSHFFTQNIKESRVLCDELQQCLHYLPPNFDKDIQQYDFRPDAETADGD